MRRIFLTCSALLFALMPGTEIEVVFQPHAHVCAHDGSHGQKRHLVASRAQDRKLIVIPSE